MTDSKSAETLYTLRTAFDDAALSPNLWMNALRVLAEACGAPHGQLIGVGGPATVMFNWISDGSESLSGLMHDPAVHDPATNYRVIAGMSAAEYEVLGEERYGPIIADLKSHEYVRIAEAHGIRHGVQTNLSTVGGHIVGLATLGTQPTSDAERAIFAAAVPFAHTAVRIQAALDHQGTQLVAGTLEAMHRAAFIIDGGGTVQAMTPEGERLLENGRPFRVSQGVLKAAHPADEDRLQALLGEALAVQASGSDHRALLLHGAEGDAPVIADIIAMPVREWAMHFRPRVIVTVRDRAVARGSDDLLRAAFGLTATETAIAQQLVAGVSRAAIAEHRDISEHTIRAHLKSIFAKVEVNRELELAARMRDFLTPP